MATRANSQFPRPDFRRQDKQPYGLRATVKERCLRYFITLGCYGAYRHGDESGSVDLRHNLFGSRLVESDPQRASAECEKMPQLPYRLDQDGREAVLAARGNTASTAVGRCWPHMCGPTMCTSS